MKLRSEAYTNKTKKLAIEPKISKLKGKRIYLWMDLFSFRKIRLNQEYVYV